MTNAQDPDYKEKKKLAARVSRAERKFNDLVNATNPPATEDEKRKAQIQFAITKVDRRNWGISRKPQITKISNLPQSIARRMLGLELYLRGSSTSTGQSFGQMRSLIDRCDQAWCQAIDFAE